MAKLVRKLMKVFGSSATVNQRAVFGSYAAGAAAFSTDVETIQSLSNWLSGWFAAVVGGNSPAIEDVNSMAFVFAYQLAYLMQAGIPEWSATTTYYIGSMVTTGSASGATYCSQTDDNLNNNPASDTTNWTRVVKVATSDEYLSDGNWTCPADVTRVRVSVSTFLNSQLGAALNSSLAITASGSAYGWGLNAVGQSGIGDQTPRSSPVLMLGGFKWRQIAGSSGGGAVLGISSSGSAYGWGANSAFLLGTGNSTDFSSPVLVLGGLKWRQLSAGGFSMGITSSGDMYSWGSGNTWGQLGQGTVGLPGTSSPVLVIGGKKWRQTTAGFDAGFGIDDSGDLYSWGHNNKGQLGQGGLLNKSSPVIVLGGLKWVKISSDAAATGVIGITTAGDAYAWGSNARGALGVGDVVARSSPVLVLGGLKWRDISIMNDSAVGVTTSGDLYAWGFNSYGQLGLGDVTPRSSPVLVLGGLKWRRAIVCYGNSDAYMMGITTTALLYAWGFNLSGQLGVGDVVPRSSPVLVLGGLNYPAVYEVQVNQMTLTVVPGTVYAVTVYGLLAMFNYIGLYQDPYGAGAMPLKITIDYDT